MKRLLSFVLILFTLALFSNNAVNWHYHRLSNGVIVEHAHPYNKAASSPGAPFENHHHSDVEYLILNLVYYSGLITVLTVLLLIVFFKSDSLRNFPGPVPVIASRHSALPLLRAPPLV
ncbi:MAG: hypothetical protein R6U58_14125 [Bacteroidales bacterium]